MSGFMIEESFTDQIRVLALKGFLDAHTAPDFEKVIEKNVNEGNVKLIIDLEKLEYISSAGLGVFMGFIEDIREKGGDIKICTANEKVFKVFDLLGFPNLFDIVDKRDDAISKFN